MAKLDAAKEEIGYLKLWEGVLAVADLSLIGWIMANRESAVPFLIFGASGTFLGVSAVIIYYSRKIERHIRSLEDL